MNLFTGKRPQFLFLQVIFWLCHFVIKENYFFEGICIAVRKKKLMHPESTLILRNILGAVGIEVSFSYFCNRVFILRLNSFKRKKISYARVKLYYIRHKLGQASRVV